MPAILAGSLVLLLLGVGGYFASPFLGLKKNDDRKIEGGLTVQGRGKPAAGGDAGAVGVPIETAPGHVGAPAAKAVEKITDRAEVLYVKKTPGYLGTAIIAPDGRTAFFESEQEKLGICCLDLVTGVRRWNYVNQEFPDNMGWRTSFALSGDGATLVTKSMLVDSDFRLSRAAHDKDQIFLAIDAKTGKPFGRYSIDDSKEYSRSSYEERQVSFVRKVQFFPDNRHFVSATKNHIALWDLQQEHPTKEFFISETDIGNMRYPGGISALSMSKDAKYILSGDFNGFIFIHDTEGRLIQLFRDHATRDRRNTLSDTTTSIRAIRPGDDADHVISAGKSTLNVWSLKTFATESSIDIAPISYGKISDDLRVVAGASATDPPRFWSIKEDRSIKIDGVTPRVATQSVALSPDGTLALRTGGGQLHLYGLPGLLRTTADLVKAEHAKNPQLADLQPSPEGPKEPAKREGPSRAAIAVLPFTPPVIATNTGLDKAMPRPIVAESTLKHGVGPLKKFELGGETRMIFTEDGRLGIISDGHSVSGWDLDTGSRKWRVNLASCWQMASSPNSQLVALHSATNLIALNTSDGKSSSVFSAITQLNGGVLSFKWLSDGVRLVVGNSGQVLSLWNMQQKKNIFAAKMQADMAKLDVSSDEMHLLLGSGMGYVRIFGMASNGRFSVVEGNFSAHVGGGNAGSGGDSTRLFFSRFSPSANHVASAGGVLNSALSLQIWERQNFGNVIYKLNIDQNATGMDLSRDWRTLVYTTVDGRIKLWSVDGGKEIPFDDTGFSGKHSYPVISGDGRFLMTQGEEYTVRLWGLPHTEPSLLAPSPSPAMTNSVPVAGIPASPAGTDADDLAGVPRAKPTGGDSTGPDAGKDGDEMAGVPRAKGLGGSTIGPDATKDTGDMAGIPRAGGSLKEVAKPKSVAAPAKKTAPPSPYAHIKNADARRYLEFAALNVRSTKAAESHLANAALYGVDEPAVMAEIKKLRVEVDKYRQKPR